MTTQLPAAGWRTQSCVWSCETWVWKTHMHPPAQRNNTPWILHVCEFACVHAIRHRGMFSFLLLQFYFSFLSTPSLLSFPSFFLCFFTFNNSTPSVHIPLLLFSSPSSLTSPLSLSLPPSAEGQGYKDEQRITWSFPWVLRLWNFHIYQQINEWKLFIPQHFFPLTTETL